MSKAKRKKGCCAYCRKRLSNPKAVVHVKCARHYLVAPLGEFRQLGFLDARGGLSAQFRWSGVPLKMVLVDPQPEAPRPKSPEEYEHTPGKCALCKLRLRNKDRKFHRACERKVNAPPPPPSIPKLPVDYPEPAWCEPCRSLDNSLYPKPFCPKCGSATGPMPDWMKPKPTKFPTRTRTRIRGR